MGAMAMEELDDSLSEALEALRGRLKLDSDGDTRNAYLVEVYALAGFSSAEIRQRMGLSSEEMRFAVRRLKRALRPWVEG